MPRQAGGSNLSNGLGVGSAEDELIVLAVGGLVVLTLLGSVGLFWAKVTAWLVEHKVLVPADASPWVRLPGGCGLDVPRVVIAGCAIAALLAIGVSAIHRRRVNNPLDGQ